MGSTRGPEIENFPVSYLKFGTAILISIGWTTHSKAAIRTLSIFVSYPVVLKYDFLAVHDQCINLLDSSTFYVH